MADGAAVFALEVSAGTAGFLIVVLLGAAASGLFVLMSRSLGRMRRNVARGEFGVTAAPRGRSSPPVPPAPREPDDGRS